MIKSTDICVDGKFNIYVSRDLTYGRRKNPAAVGVAIKAIQSSFPVLKTLLDIPDDVLFRIARMKGRHVGKYVADTRTVVLDPYNTWDSIYETIAHELVHAEQFYQGRLEHVYDKRKGWLHHWKGQLNTSKGMTYNSYRNQPWEVEAFKRAPELVRKVHKLSK